MIGTVLGYDRKTAMVKWWVDTVKIAEVVPIEVQEAIIACYKGFRISLLPAGMWS